MKFITDLKNTHIKEIIFTFSDIGVNKNYMLFWNKKFKATYIFDDIFISTKNNVQLSWLQNLSHDATHTVNIVQFRK